MDQPKRYKEPVPKKPSSKKASTIKTLILLLAISLIAGLFIWLQFFPKPVEEAIEKEPKVEDTTKEIKPTTEIVTETEETKNPEGVVTRDEQEPSKSDTTESDESELESTDPVIVEEEPVEERVEERDQEAILASALPKVYTVYTDSQQGSGFLYNANGDIVTNAHVVDGYSTVTVMNNAGVKFVGQVIGISESIDIALIRVEAIVGKEPMIMDLNKSAEGTSVIAIGSPNNKSNTATMGKVTATGKDFYESFTYTDLYEIDAPIAPGSSGGPLLDAKSEKVIGVNSIILTDNPSIGYSIPVYSVYQLLKSWATNPIESKDPVIQKPEDAYFDKEYLSVFIEGYMTLYTYAQNEVNFSYLEGYLLPDSPVYNSEKEIISNLKDQQKQFTINQFTMGDIKIHDNLAIITTTTETLIEQKGKKSSIVKEQVVYDVVIDEYGDYMIKNMTRVYLSYPEEVKVDPKDEEEVKPEDQPKEDEVEEEKAPEETTPEEVPASEE
ncbi:S1C family serine protease [Paenisporosarcina antarctica]|uniref:Trypsin-like serine protease n=1 Tax=Paenisporosarcina antarctica TaxID=417367 RepID=A0A4P6ZZ62_9BACL|nr:trypsin-like peptidase domain-containing protein [Paenisporosarcina antarctica]QBP42030.1 trypsin-like serine protease [Paenisporosarcina antarctica]